MQQITININPSIYEHIMFFLQNLPKNMLNIEPHKNITTPSKPSTKAFGILKGQVKDPVAWQREMREENDKIINPFE